MNTKLRNLIIKSTLAISASLAVCAAASAGVLTTSISVDNGFAAYLSTSANDQGTQFSQGNNWGVATTGSISLTDAAAYYLHISAYDQGGVAGMLGQFSLAGTGYHFADNSTYLLTGSSLITANAIGYTAASTATTNWGGNGVSPWGAMTTIDSSAQWIWSGNNDTNDYSYFTIAILKDAPANVPEPGSLGLLGLGLLAASRFSRKGKKAQ